MKKKQHGSGSSWQKCTTRYANALALESGWTAILAHKIIRLGVSKKMSEFFLASESIQKSCYHLVRHGMRSKFRRDKMSQYQGDYNFFEKENRTFSQSAHRNEQFNFYIIRDMVKTLEYDVFKHEFISVLLDVTFFFFFSDPP